MSRSSLNYLRTAWEYLQPSSPRRHQLSITLLLFNPYIFLVAAYPTPNRSRSSQTRPTT